MSLTWLVQISWNTLKWQQVTKLLKLEHCVTATSDKVSIKFGRVYFFQAGVAILLCVILP